MSHQYRIHDAKFVIFKVVLFQHAQALAWLHLDGAFVGLQLTADSSQQGRLSCTVGTDNAVDVTTCKLHVDVLVERLFTKLNSQICDCYHFLSFTLLFFSYNLILASGRAS